MKLLVAFALVGLIAGQPKRDPCHSTVEVDYHNKIGIPKAARIKATEEALGHIIRIAGGQPASPGQYPYFGGLLITMTNGFQSVCGSTLLSNTRAVTAAHCWRTLYSQGEKLTVVLGSTLLFSGGTRIRTSDVELHEGYNMTTLANDVAIIRLPWVDFDRSQKFDNALGRVFGRPTTGKPCTANDIHSIPFATGNKDYVGAWAQAIGFGRNGDRTQSPPNRHLSHVFVQVISNEVCAQTYRDHVTNSTLCIDTTGGRGTCNGDSGGPLVAENRLIGVTSFGHQGDCQRNNPTGFSRVTCFAKWIEARL